MLIAVSVSGVLALSGNVEVASAAPPSNDNIANAIILNPVASTKTVTASNVDATLETGEASLSDGDWNSWQRSVWYKITPPAGIVEFNTINSDFDTMLAAFTFDTPVGFVNPSLLALNDERFQNSQSAIAFTADGVSTYYIGVAGWNTFSGNITLNWSYPPAATNDDIGDAIALNDTGETRRVNNTFNSTLETGEEQMIDNAGFIGTWGNSVWFTVQPAAGAWGLRLENHIGAQIAVLDGPTFAATVVGGGSNAIGFNADGTTAYYIGIATPNAEQSFDLIFQSIVTPGIVSNVIVTRGTNTTVSWSPPVNFDPDIHAFTVSMSQGDLYRSCMAEQDGVCSFPRLQNGTWTLDIVAWDVRFNYYGIFYIDNNLQVNNLSNDYFASATSLSGDSGQLSDYFDLASLEIGEPVYQPGPRYSSLWYSYTPSTTGTSTVSVATTNSELSGDLSPLVAVYTGTNVSALQAVGTASNSVTWNSVANQRYYLAVSTTRDFAEYMRGEPEMYHTMTWSHVAAPAPTAAPTTTTTVPVSKVISFKVKNNATMASILKKAKIKPPKNSKVTYKIANSSKKLCSISSSKMKFKKKGTCNLSVKVQPKKGASTTYQLAATT